MTNSQTPAPSPADRYRVTVTLADGRSWTDEHWFLGPGSTFVDEDDLLHAISYQFTDGNYGCDCNKRIFLEDMPPGDDENECGETMPTRSILVTTPDGRQIELLAPPG